MSSCATTKAAEPVNIPMGYIKSSCNVMDAIKEIAVADMKSTKEGTKVFYAYSLLGNCGSHSPPVWVPLEKKVLSYTDSEGIHTEVWKVVAHELYAIVAKEQIRYIDQNGNAVKDIRVQLHGVTFYLTRKNITWDFLYYEYT
jgi:hypothetical protein